MCVLCQHSSHRNITFRVSVLFSVLFSECFANPTQWRVIDAFVTEFRCDLWNILRQGRFARLAGCTRANIDQHKNLWMPPSCAHHPPNTLSTSRIPLSAIRIRFSTSSRIMQKINMVTFLFHLSNRRLFQYTAPNGKQHPYAWPAEHTIHRGSFSTLAADGCYFYRMFVFIFV